MLYKIILNFESWHEKKYIILKLKLMFNNKLQNNLNDKCKDKKYLNLPSKIIIHLLLKHEQQTVVQKYRMEYNGM